MRWSDRRPVTTRHVEFWLRQLTPNQADRDVHAPGGWPDLIASMAFMGPYRFQITSRHPVNDCWALCGEWSQIVPVPQHA